MRVTREMILRLKALRAELVAQADGASPVIARILDRMERALLRAIDGGGDVPIDARDISLVLAKMGEIVPNGNREVSKWLVQELPQAGLNGISTQIAWAEAIGASRRVQNALTALKTGTLERVAKMLTPQDLAGQWASPWVARWESVESRLRSEMLRGRALGLSWHDLAQQIQTPLGDLDLGLSNPEAFANSFARSALTDMATQESIQAAREVGIEKFVNIGVGDERQSDICAEASQQPPMTVEEWAASEWGLPSRHPNCRCDLGGVPPEIEGEITQGVGSYLDELEEVPA